MATEPGEELRTAILHGPKVMEAYRDSLMVEEIVEPIVFAFDLRCEQSRAAAGRITHGEFEKKYAPHEAPDEPQIFIAVTASNRAYRERLAKCFKPSWEPYFVPRVKGHVPVLVFAAGNVGFALRCAHPEPLCTPGVRRIGHRAA